MSRISLFYVVFIIICSCIKDDTSEILIDPSNANELSKVLVMPSGTQSITGETPKNTSAGAPNVVSQNSNALGSNGSTAPLIFSYSNVQTNLRGCYARVSGANSYFNIPYSSNSGINGNISLPVGIPTNVDQGQFCVEFSVYDINGRVSNIAKTCVSVIRLGTGALQISLTWGNGSDQDLYVYDPTGCEIYYDDPICKSGQLDRDDTDGFGPENIFWEKDAPDGLYSVEVVDYENVRLGTDFFVNINAPGVSRQFTGRTQNGNTIKVITFTKRGNNFTF